jgi:hypothetical protein
MFNRGMTVVAVLGACTALAACGSSDDSSSPDETVASTSAAALTSAEFVARADAICKGSQKQVLELTREGGTAQASGESPADSFGRLADLLRSVESNLAALTPPEDLASTYETYLKGVQAAAATTGDLATAMAQVPPGQVSPEMRTIGEKLSQQHDDSAKIAAELGFKVCG